MNNTLQHYLDAYFATDTACQELKLHFANVHGVDVKQEDDLFLFKYDQLNVKWSPLTYACRGTIMRLTPEGWVYCSRPWDKFFTYGDSKCKIAADTSISVGDGYHLTNKYDGSCIQMWYDTKKDTWRYSTLGTITTLHVNDSNKTFGELFDKLFHDPLNSWKEMNWMKTYTYLFELCTAENRIVTQYDADHIKLLSCRCNDDGTYMPALYTSEFLNGCMTGAEIQELAEEMALTTDYGINPEGFVLYKDAVPVAKFKNSRYLVLHNAAGGDKMHTINCIVDAFFAGNLDDIEGCLPVSRKKYARYVRDWWAGICQALTVYAEILGATTYATQKDYALAVQHVVARQFMQSFFYKNRAAVAARQIDLQTINEWSKTLNNKYTLVKEYINEIEAIPLSMLT